MDKTAKTLKSLWHKAKPHALAFAVTGALSLAFAMADPATTFLTAACRVAGALANTSVAFGAMLLIILWAGYSIYMGKRDATEVVVRGLLATAVILGVRTVTGWFVSGSCPAGT